MHHVEQVDQDEKDEAPAYQAVEQARPEPEAEDRLERCHAHQHVRQAFPRQLPVRTAVPGRDEAYQPADGEVDRRQGGQDGQGEDDFFRKSKHRII